MPAAAAGPAQFLDDWLRPAPAPPPSSSSAQAILAAWSDLRDPSIHSSPDRLLSSLRLLSSSRSALHVADPHAKLILSIISSPSLPPHSIPFIFSLLHAWLRKSLRPSQSLLDSALSLIIPLDPSPLWVLLLGAATASPTLPESSRESSLELLSRLLEEKRADLLSQPDLLPELLAGIGYALSRSSRACFARIFSCLLQIWDLGGGGLRPVLRHGEMILRLVEWVAMVSLSSRDLNRVELLCEGVSVEKCEARSYSWFALPVASAGVLRALRRTASGKKLALSPHMVSSLERSIGFVSSRAVLGIRSHPDGHESRLLIQCVAFGLARSGPISFDPHVLLSLCLALMNEIFPLVNLLRKMVENRNGDSKTVAMLEAKEVLECLLFNEAGEVTGAFCNQYSQADEDSRALVENYIWEYCLDLYSNLRKAALMHRSENGRLGDIERIAEDAFLMIAVFAAEVTKQNLNPKSPHSFQPGAAVKILGAFSCVEYLRRVRLPKYTDAVRQAVLTIQENSAACASFVELMPPYAELTELHDLNEKRYMWAEDEVQTARVFFYLRVIPTCVALIPASLFSEVVTPAMFLYMQHPNVKVSRASHSVFASFLSSEKDSEQEDRSTLKEQLVFYYVQRALEAYPGITPFEGLSSGVAALMRHIPAGSSAIYFCVRSLMEKAQYLYGRAIAQDANLWKPRGGAVPESCEKITELLLRLVSLVDIQVFPYTLKQLSELIIQLPRDGQNTLLAQLYSLVAESDDVTRKPALVSWLQSLSYVCSQEKLQLLSGNSGGPKEYSESSIPSQAGSRL